MMKKVTFPGLTHKQYFVLKHLERASWTTGEELREKLKASGFELAKAGFYQFMERLRESDFISLETNIKDRILCSSYRLNVRGEQETERTKKFYCC